MLSYFKDLEIYCLFKHILVFSDLWDMNIVICNINTGLLYGPDPVESNISVRVTEVLCYTH